MRSSGERSSPLAQPLGADGMLRCVAPLLHLFLFVTFQNTRRHQPIIGRASHAPDRKITSHGEAGQIWGYGFREQQCSRRVARRLVNPSPRRGPET